ncbi:AFG1/ZapE family ATPase [Lentzea sp. NPDC059081]|uniref:AFG1/ZapE family ATPase n=1 Tax=Lentzea sp. NPDC059081 TaxID=3346719 RepID=UPI0036C21C36
MDQHDRVVVDLRAHVAGNGHVLDVNGRALTALAIDGRRIWFDFGDLCGKPTSTQDYLVLAERFDDRVVAGVPLREIVGGEALDVARTASELEVINTTG